ncbi:MAG: dihydropteroate synthase [Candidatus Aadella gelida]|nr:dihydropteroate synthase [Candidatus Aadella gelida]
MKKDLRIKNSFLPVSRKVCIMGILNITPDSFSDGGRYIDARVARDKALEMISNGADIIDIGGESSRSGSREITPEEEKERVIPVIKALKDVKVPLSIDTWKADVAQAALEEGVSVINDITALGGDADMASIAAKYDAGLILMHMKGMPRDMQDDPQYKDIMKEICSYLSESIKKAEDAGLNPDNIGVDPGIGFGKTLEHNLTILNELDKLDKLGKVILVGPSRKSFIGTVTGKDTRDRLSGTIAASMFAIMKGAGIIRVHDVDAVKDAVLMIRAITKE